MFGLQTLFPEEAERPRACDAAAVPQAAARALEILRERGWAQHVTLAADGAVCGGGAVFMAAAGDQWLPAWAGQLPCPLAIAVLEKCADIIREQFHPVAAAGFAPDRGRAAQNAMIGFNDAPGCGGVPAQRRTRADVELVLEKAAAG
jgi:hypothetical protein